MQKQGSPLTDVVKGFEDRNREDRAAQSTSPVHPLHKETTIPSTLCGVPLLEELFRKNRDQPLLPNEMLMRVLTHESILYRGFMERKRRVKRLAKFMDRDRKLEIERVNRAWIVEMGRMLRDPAFEFAPEQFQKFRLSSGKQVKFAVPSPRDEIILDSLRLVLDAIYEPRFSEFSFGFRPDRGRQVALRNVKNHIRGMDYYIVGDLSSALQQRRGLEMVQCACQHVHDPCFEQLLYRAFDTGYVNTYGLKAEIFVAVPKEMGISPVLLNCYMHEFDKWLEIYKQSYSDASNPLRWPIIGRHTNSMYRQLRFVRCGAALFIGLRGSRAEAHSVAGEIRHKLQQMGMDSSQIEMQVYHTYRHSKTKERAQFLGYEISREHSPSDGPSAISEEVDLQARALFLFPTLRLRQLFFENGFLKMSKLNTWIPFGVGNITHWPVEHIVRYFDRLTVGLLEFYALADNFRQLKWFVYILKRSCNLTVGRKLKLSSMRKVFNKYGRDLEVKDGDTVVATLPDRSLSVRPIVKDFYPELTPYLRRRRFITRGIRQNEDIPHEDTRQDNTDSD